MTEHQLLQNIIANPDSDAPRLIYADWLEEQGNIDRAEFTRVQCELAALPRYDLRKSELQARERRLLVEHIPEWWHDYEISGPFRRGFVESLSFDSPEEFFERADAAFANSPIRHVSFIDQGDDWTQEAIEELKKCLLLQRVRSIYLECDILESDIFSVLLSPYLTNLEALEIFAGDILSNVQFRELMTKARDISGWPERLKKLWLSFDDIDGNTTEFLIESRLLSNCRSLRIQNGQNLSFDHLEALLSAADLNELRELEFQADIGTEKDAARVAHTLLFSGNIRRLAINLPYDLFLTLPHLGKVEELRLYRWHQSTLPDLSRCSNFRQLRRLDFPYCNLQPADIREVADCSHLEGLQALSLLRNPGVDDEAAESLASSHYFRDLRFLDISSTGIQAAGLQDVIQSRLAEHIRVLLDSNPKRFSSSLLHDLTASPWLQNLTTLELPRLPDSPDLEPFLTSPRLPLLTFFLWWFPPMSTTDLEQLIQSKIAWPGFLQATLRKYPEFYQQQYLLRFGEHFDGYRHMEWREPFFPDNDYLE